MAEEGSFSVLSTAGTSSETGSEVTDREREKVKVEDPEDGEMEEMDSSELVLSHQEAMSKVEAAIDEIVSVSWSVLTSYYANYQYNICQNLLFGVYWYIAICKITFMYCQCTSHFITCAIKWSIYVVLKCMALTYFEIYYQLMDTLHHTLHE